MKELSKAYKIKFSDLESSTQRTEIEENKSESSDEESESSESELSSEDKDKIDVKMDGEGEESEEEKSIDKPIKKTAIEIDENEKDLKIEEHKLYDQYEKRIKSIKLLDLEARIKDKAFNKMYADNFIDASERITIDALSIDKEYEDDVRQVQLDILKKKKDELNEKLMKASTDREKLKQR